MVRRVAWQICRAGVALFMVIAGAGGSLWAQASHVSPCYSNENRQFDFWVGDWDAFEVNDLKTSVAHLSVEKILNGCVVKESYDGANGVKGQSFSIYDKTRAVWHQSWVTNGGQLLIIEGQLQDGKMVLSGADKSSDGKERLVRGTWAPENGGVRETAVRSTDHGLTWQPWFDLIFKPAAEHQVKSN